MNIKKLFSQIKNTFSLASLTPTERDMMFEQILEKTQRSSEVGTMNTSYSKPNMHLVSRYSRGYRILLQSIALSIVVMLISGGGLIAAAQQALPGESLYNIKVNITEELRSKLYRSPELKAQYDIKRAELRIDETVALLRKAGAIDPMTESLIARHLNKHILEATNISKSINGNDLESHQKFIQDVSQKLSLKKEEVSRAISETQKPTTEPKDSLEKEGSEVLKVTEFHLGRSNDIDEKIDETYLTQASENSSDSDDGVTETPLVKAADEAVIALYYEKLLLAETFLDERINKTKEKNIEKVEVEPNTETEEVLEKEEVSENTIPEAEIVDDKELESETQPEISVGEIIEKNPYTLNLYELSDTTSLARNAYTSKENEEFVELMYSLQDDLVSFGRKFKKGTLNLRLESKKNILEESREYEQSEKRRR